MEGEVELDVGMGESVMTAMMIPPKEITEKDLSRARTVMTRA